MGWARDLGRTGRRRRVVRERPGGRRPLVGAGLAAAIILRRGVDRCCYRLLVAAVESGRGTYLLLGTRRHAAGGSYPGSVRRLPPTRVLHVRRRPPRDRDRGPVPRGRPPADATSWLGDARVRDHGGLHGVRRLFQLAHRLQLHVPRGGPDAWLATVRARSLAVVHPQWRCCRSGPATDPGCAVSPPPHRPAYRSLITRLDPG